MADVFISYRNRPERRAFARRLALILRAYNVSVWWDYGLEAGEGYREQITQELSNACLVVPLWCEMSVKSEWVLKEANLGQDKLVSARLQLVDIPREFEANHAADLTDWDGYVSHPRVTDFARLICRRLDKPDSAPADSLEELGGLAILSPLPAMPYLLEPVANAFAAQTTSNSGPSSPSADEAYVAIKNSDDPVDWETFATDFQDSGLAIGARARARRIRKEVQLKSQEELAAHREIEAAEVWHHIEDGHDPDAVEDFFKRFTGTKVWAKAARQSGYVVAEIGFRGQFLLKTGFRFDDDAKFAPQMIVVPAGEFWMGSKSEGINQKSRPDRIVTIAKPFAVGVAPVTRGQFAAFLKDTGHDMSGSAYGWTGNSWLSDLNISWLKPGFPQDEDHPVVCVNWNDTKAYIDWLCAVTGDKPYRLLTEAEWEYCCGANNTTTDGNSCTTSEGNVNFGENEGGTTSVGKYLPNNWGLRDMQGNVWEWCEDNWHKDYSGDPPEDGSVWQGGDRSLRVVRGGSWVNPRIDLRIINRNGDRPDCRYNNFGFRVAREL